MTPSPRQSPIRTTCLIALFFFFKVPAAFTQTEPSREPESVSRLRKANAEFAFRYFQTVAEARPTENIMLMPWGLSYTFGLLQNGASPAAKKEIESAFGFEIASSQEINESFEYVHLRLAGPPGPQPPPGQPPRLTDLSRFKGIRFLSSFWLKSSASYRAEFLATNQKYYQHDLRRLPRDGHAALREINAAVRADTGGHMNDVFPTLDKEDFVLLTTTHLKCGWGKPFKEQKTQDAPFHLLSGEIKTVPMMADDGLYGYARGDGFQAAELHCDNYRLQIFLPDKDSSLAALRQRINLANWREWTKSMKPTYINLKLPRFRIATSENARQHLERMGLQQIFHDPKSLLPMVEGMLGANLTQGIEKAVLEVDEHGMEAGSVVGFGGILGGILAGQPPPEFVVDRPFLFVISHWDGTVLYIGMTVDPTPLKPRAERG